MGRKTRFTKNLRVEFTKNLFSIVNNAYAELPNGKVDLPFSKGEIIYQVRQAVLRENWTDWHGSDIPKVQILIMTSASTIPGWEDAGINFMQEFYPDYERRSPTDRIVNRLLLSLYNELPDGNEGRAAFFRMKRYKDPGGQSILRLAAEDGIHIDEKDHIYEPAFFREDEKLHGKKDVSFNLVPLVERLAQDGIFKTEQKFELSDGFSFEKYPHHRVSYGGQSYRLPNKRLSIKQKYKHKPSAKVEFREIPSKVVIASLEEILETLQLEVEPLRSKKRDLK